MRVHQIKFNQNSAITRTDERETKINLNEMPADSFQLSNLSRTNETLSFKVKLGNAYHIINNTLIPAVKLAGNKHNQELVSEETFSRKITESLKLAEKGLLKEINRDVAVNNIFDALEELYLLNLKSPFKHLNNKILDFAQEHFNSTDLKLNQRFMSFFIDCATTTGERLEKVLETIGVQLKDNVLFISGIEDASFVMKKASNFGEENVPEIQNKVVQLIESSFLGADAFKKGYLLAESKSVFEQITDKAVFERAVNFLSDVLKTNPKPFIQISKSARERAFVHKNAKQTLYALYEHPQMSPEKLDELIKLHGWNKPVFPDQIIRSILG